MAGPQPPSKVVPWIRYGIPDDMDHQISLLRSVTTVLRRMISFYTFDSVDLDDLQQQKLNMANIAQALLQRGAKSYPDPDSPPTDDERKSTLMFAVEMENVDLVKVLVNHGARFNPAGDDGWRTIILKLVDGPLNILRTMAESPLPVLPDPNYQVDNVNGDSMLHFLARNNFSNLKIRYLLDMGADPRKPNRYGDTAIDIAIEHLHDRDEVHDDPELQRQRDYWVTHHNMGIGLMQARARSLDEVEQRMEETRRHALMMKKRNGYPADAHISALSDEIIQKMILDDNHGTMYPYRLHEYQM